MAVSVSETVGLREANQDFSGLVERIARTGRGVLVTKRGVPIVRILPVDDSDAGLTAEQSAILERALGQKLPLVPWRFDRDELHER
jgi:prevent-host-death family protein